MFIPEHILEIFLQPGDFYWGDETTRIRTILGSCIAICLWHPILREGGMCHYMLPSRGGTPPGAKLNGKYGDEAWQLFVKEIHKRNTKPSEYIVKIFGGSSMFAAEKQEKEFNQKLNMGQKNIDLARKIISENHLKVVSENLGGNKSRRIHFDVWSGNVWLKSQIYEGSE
jgi:chemotaxis protein CheD